MQCAAGALVRPTLWETVLKLKTLMAGVLATCTLTAAYAAPTGSILRIGCEATYPPFEFFDSKNGKTVGFDIDIVKAIARRLGYSIEINSMGFDAIIPALMTGTVDVGASAFTITEERAKKVLFTQPYYLSGLTVLIRSEDKKRIVNVEDLNNCTICAQIGTSGAMRAQEVPGAKVKIFNTVAETFMELGNRGCDAVIGDKPVNSYFLKSRASTAKRFYQLPNELNTEEFGIALAKNNAKLHKKFDKALSDMKADGEYANIYRKCFGAALK